MAWIGTWSVPIMLLLTLVVLMTTKPVLPIHHLSHMNFQNCGQTLNSSPSIPLSWLNPPFLFSFGHNHRPSPISYPISVLCSCKQRSAGFLLSPSKLNLQPLFVLHISFAAFPISHFFLLSKMSISKPPLSMDQPYYSYYSPLCLHSFFFCGHFLL